LVDSVVHARVANLQTYLDSQTLLMTLACAAAFARSPSLQTWCRVKAFKYNSWQLARWLSEAMMAYVQVTLSARDAYVLLAKEVFSGLKNFSLQSKFDRTNKARACGTAGTNVRTSLKKYGGTCAAGKPS
jgi:hypothetical protein